MYRDSYNHTCIHTCTHIPHLGLYYVHTHTSKFCEYQLSYSELTCVSTHTLTQYVHTHAQTGSHMMCVCVILMVPEFAWEAGTFRAALSASVSEDICITILLWTLFQCDNNTHIHTCTDVGISWAGTGELML